MAKDLGEPSLNALKSMLSSGFVETRYLGGGTQGLGSDSICSALINRGFATKRIGVFSAAGALMPDGTVKEDGMTTRQILEITEAGRVRACAT